MFILKYIYKNIERIAKNGWFFPFLLLIGYGVFYFFLKDKFLFTPDFTGTDVFHFNISYKYYLWKSIRSGIIPFWTDKLNGGFPLIAESQIGTFSLPYYLIFPFFSSFSHAYAFLFSFHLFLLSIGMYLLLRIFKVPSFLSFLLTIIFAWNGSITFRWVHFIVLQSFSFTPLLYWTYFKWNESQRKKYLLLLSLVINQMVFAGYIQVAFFSLLGLIILFVIQNYPLNRKRTIIFVCALFFGLFLSLPQILPTLQLIQYAGRPVSSSYDFAVSVPFNIRNLCSFFSPNCLGSSQNSTYPLDWQSNGIYWENTPYVGQLFVVVVVLSSIYFFKTCKKYKLIYILLSLFFLFLLLALGKNSPLYFIFSIFPFSMFRSPPRYLLPATFFLMIYSSLILKQIIKKNTYVSIFIYVVLILNCMLLIRTALTYHLFIGSSAIYQSLGKQKLVNSELFYITYGAVKEWNKVFSKQGWASKKSVKDYLFINRALLPNSNLIFGQSSFDIYASLEMRRQQFLKSIIFNGLAIAENSNIESSQSARIENILQLYTIDSIISFKQLFLPHFKSVQTMTEGSITILTYQNTDYSHSNEYYIPKIIKKITHVEELEEKIYLGTLSQNDSLAESLPNSLIKNSSRVSVYINKNGDQYMKSTITTNRDAFIVWKKNWYPDWRLYVDGKQQTIYKTNLIHIGFIVPKGTHSVELVYVPMSFYFGCLISLIASVVVITFVLKTIKRRE